MSSKKSKAMAELMDSACFKWYIMAKVLIIVSRCFIIFFSCCLKYSCSVFFPRMMRNHVPSDFLPLMKNNIEGFISLHILPRQIRTTWPTILSLFKFGSKRKHHLRTDGGKGLVSHWSNIANWPLRGSKNTPNEQVWNRQEIKMRSKSVSGDRQQSDLSGWKILIEIKEALVRFHAIDSLTITVFSRTWKCKFRLPRLCKNWQHTKCMPLQVYDVEKSKEISCKA